ncbi:MAG: hypothetical protein KBS66_01040, partial [Eubacterium sp.]|nr:hypothetical protein [Candidatus Colimonas fimequi]
IDDIFFGLMAMALCPMVKIMGCDYTSIHTKTAKENGNIEFASAIVEYPVGEAVINVGNQIRVENKMEIIGTKGTIRLRDNWWKGNYFELDKVGSSEPEIFNMNFEGNGFKFLLRQFASMLKNGRTESMGLFNRESIKITEILETIIKEGK